MIIAKKTIILTDDNGRASGVARIESFKDKITLQLNAGNIKDMFVAVAIGDDCKIMKTSSDKLYLGKQDISCCIQIAVLKGDRVLLKGCSERTDNYDKLIAFAKEALRESDSQRIEIKEDIKEIFDKCNEMTCKKQNNDAKNILNQTVEESDSKKQASEGIESIAENMLNNSVESDEVICECADGSTAIQEQENAQKSEKTQYVFYEKIKDNINSLLQSNEKEEVLQRLIPQSRWAKVYAEDGYYVVGVVGEPVEFICYGIPDDDNTNPPDTSPDCRQWFEIERGGKGYWMMYQSAQDGRTLTAF